MINGFISRETLAKNRMESLKKTSQSYSLPPTHYGTIHNDDPSLQFRIADQFHPNQDICFKCKQYGQIYCCENCFRSFHWDCIGSKKLDELKKMTHAINFICQCCDQKDLCQKCLSQYPTNHNFNLIDYSDNRSILSFFRCTHCNSKIHRKCYDIPYESLERDDSNYDGKKSDSLPNYVCQKCIATHGIAWIIYHKRFKMTGDHERIYYLVLLKANSPVHKGWFSEAILRKLLSTFDRKKFIDEYNENSNFLNPEIQKIINIKVPLKYRGTPIKEVLAKMEQKSKKASSVSERYGLPDNFKFLIKWKDYNYSTLTWEDETIALKNLPELKRFLAEKQKWADIANRLNQIKWNTKLLIDSGGYKRHNREFYKLIEPLLTSKSDIQSKYLCINKDFQSSNKIQVKSFQEKMQTLDIENSEDPFVEVIDIEDFKENNIKSPNEYMNKIVSYFQKCHMTEIILRPILIVSDEVNDWEEALKNQKKQNDQHLRYLKFSNGKQNVNAIKRWAFYVSSNPLVFKFDILLMDFNYFAYQKEFIFKRIPVFFAVLFDRSECVSNESRKIQFLKEHYFPLKTHVQKEIYIVENTYLEGSMENFANSILKLTEHTSQPVKKSVCHSMNFEKIVRFNSSEPELKLILDKNLAQATNTFEQRSNELLNEGQRRSFLKFILSYGFNVTAVDKMCQKLKQMNPEIWESDRSSIQKIKNSVSKYLNLFVSIIKKNSKDIETKVDRSIIDHYLFSFKGEDVFKRILQLEKLRTQIQKCKQDREKFPITKHFVYFAGNFGCISFPLWNVYEDYTLGALIIEEGYDRWNNLMGSEKWRNYHKELEKRRFYEMDKKDSKFKVMEKIVPVKKKSGTDSGEQLRGSHCGQSDSNNKNGPENKIKTYGDYLIQKITNMKDKPENNDYERLTDLNELKKHIAERGKEIINSMNF